LKKRIDVDTDEQNLYKAFELFPQAKMALEIGEEAANNIMDLMAYLTSLTIPRNLSFLGYNIDICLMDPETALFIRDHPVFCNIKKISDRGLNHQFGFKLLEAGNAPESLLSSGSEIALVQKEETGDIILTRKKKMGLENKHNMDLIKKFHKIGEKKAKQEEYTENDVKLLEEDHDIKAMKLVKKRSEEKKAEGEEDEQPPWA